MKGTPIVARIKSMMCRRGIEIFRTVPRIDLLSFLQGKAGELPGPRVSHLARTNRLEAKWFLSVARAWPAVRVCRSLNLQYFQ